MKTVKTFQRGLTTFRRLFVQKNSTYITMTAFPSLVGELFESVILELGEN
jgi:hypothetical protein